MAELVDGEEVSGPVDLGPLLGARRGFKSREKEPWSSGMGGAEMDVERRDVKGKARAADESSLTDMKRAFCQPLPSSLLLILGLETKRHTSSFETANSSKHTLVPANEGGGPKLEREEEAVMPPKMRKRWIHRQFQGLKESTSPDSYFLPGHQDSSSSGKASTLSPGPKDSTMSPSEMGSPAVAVTGLQQEQTLPHKLVREDSSTMMPPPPLPSNKLHRKLGSSDISHPGPSVPLASPSLSFANLSIHSPASTFPAPPILSIHEPSSSTSPLPSSSRNAALSPSRIRTVAGRSVSPNVPRSVSPNVLPITSPLKQVSASEVTMGQDRMCFQLSSVWVTNISLDPRISSPNDLRHLHSLPESSKVVYQDEDELPHKGAGNNHQVRFASPLPAAQPPAHMLAQTSPSPQPRGLPASQVHEEDVDVDMEAAGKDEQDQMESPPPHSEGSTSASNREAMEVDDDSRRSIPNISFHHDASSPLSELPSPRAHLLSSHLRELSRSRSLSPRALLSSSPPRSASPSPLSSSALSMLALSHASTTRHSLSPPRLTPSPPLHASSPPRRSPTPPVQSLSPPPKMRMTLKDFAMRRKKQREAMTTEVVNTSEMPTTEEVHMEQAEVVNISVVSTVEEPIADVEPAPVPVTLSEEACPVNATDSAETPVVAASNEFVKPEVDMTETSPEPVVFVLDAPAVPVPVIMHVKEAPVTVITEPSISRTPPPVEASNKDRSEFRNTATQEHFGNGHIIHPKPRTPERPVYHHDAAHPISPADVRSPAYSAATSARYSSPRTPEGHPQSPSSTLR